MGAVMNTYRLARRFRPFLPFVVAALLPIAGGCTVEAEVTGAAPADPSHAVPSVFLPYVASNIGDLALATAPAVSVTSTCKVGATTATDIHITCGAAAERVSKIVRVGNRDALVIPIDGLSVAAGATLTLDGDYPIIFVVRGAVQIDGRVDLSASRIGGYEGLLGSANGLDKYKESNVEGAGPACRSGSEVGAGGGSFCGVGGGAATSRVYGTETLIPLVPGAPGGAGYSNGGAGGGALQISAASIAIGRNGVIDAGGGFGAFIGGGGGSGGAVLLEGVTVQHAGFIAANGAGGGAMDSRIAGAGHPATGDGNRAKGGTTDLGNNGGDGSSADDPNGTAGVYAADGPSPDLKKNAGGGGGGAGRIRINTRLAAVGAATDPFGFSGAGGFSPSAATGCSTLGGVQERLAP